MIKKEKLHKKLAEKLPQQQESNNPSGNNEISDS